MSLAANGCTTASLGISPWKEMKAPVDRMILL